MVKISIVTAVYNRAKTISDAIDSVLGQTGCEIEYIVVDGLSKDGTEDVVRSYGDRITKYIREKDSGIYDALNKGVAAATGDVIGFLHADDVLAGTDIARAIAEPFKNASIDAVFGDLQYVDAENTNRVIRNWKSGQYDRSKFLYGWMPAHPTFYLRREHYQNLGVYRDDFQIAADYELMLRMLFKNQLNAKSIDKVLVKMRVGGKSNSSIANRLVANREDARAWSLNDLKAPMGLRWMKPLRKIGQYF